MKVVDDPLNSKIKFITPKKAILPTIINLTNHVGA